MIKITSAEEREPVMLEEAEQRPMNNEYVNIMNTIVTLADIFKLYSEFLLTLQTRNHEVNRRMFHGARFSLEWQKEL